LGKATLVGDIRLRATLQVEVDALRGHVAYLKAKYELHRKRHGC
jgi:hypothetical protein